MKAVIRSIEIIFSRREYIIYFFTVSLFFLLFISLIPNLDLVRLVSFSTNGGIFLEIESVLGILYSELFDFGAVKGLSSILISILFGINVSFIIYYSKMYKASFVSAASAISTGALLSGILGIGCLSCGSLVVAALASVFSLSGVLLLLPLGGLEFTILSFALILFSTMLISRKISSLGV